MSRVFDCGELLFRAARTTLLVAFSTKDREQKMHAAPHKVEGSAKVPFLEMVLKLGNKN
jgi:hypothetical protein